MPDDTPKPPEERLLRAFLALAREMRNVLASRGSREVRPDIDGGLAVTVHTRHPGSAFELETALKVALRPMYAPFKYDYGWMDIAGVRIRFKSSDRETRFLTGDST